MIDFAPLATVSRDGLIESTHLGDVALVDVSGALRASVGDPSRHCYYRSSGKPLQALGVVQSGAADKYAFTQTELSICCASHSGSAMHVATVQGILEKLDLDGSALACGCHQPGDEAERNRLIREGLSPTPLHNNCSGKHAGMLATARALGAPVEGYLDHDHPVQKLIRHNLELATGVPQERFIVGADGCGAPTVGLPLQAIALSFARLGNPEGMPDDFRDAARRVCAAMAAAPDMVSAPGAFNSELLGAGNGHLVAKAGAEGLFALGIIDPRHLGLAAKIADGSSRAQAAIVMHLLTQLGAISDSAHETLARFITPDVCNCHGRIVGQIEPVFELEAQ